MALESRQSIDYWQYEPLRRVYEAIYGMRSAPHENEIVQGIREGWPWDAIRLDGQQRDIVGRLFLGKMLGVDNDTLESFEGDGVNARLEVWERIGYLKHPVGGSGLPRSAEFWTAVSRSVPNLLGPEEVQQLSLFDESGELAWEMITVFDEVSPESGVIEKFVHLY